MPDQSDSRDGVVVEEAWNGTTAVLNCSGVLDMLTSQRLEQALAATVEKQPAAVIVDLTAVDFLASHAMGMLVAAHDRLTPEIGFAVVADGPGTSRPLTMIGIADRINMHATLEAALAATSGGSVT